MMPLMTAAVALAEMAPTISKWFGHAEDNAQSTQNIVQQVVGLAKKLTQTEDPQEAIQRLMQDPQLLVHYQQTLAKMDSDLEKTYLKDREDARQRDAVIVAAGRSNTRADVMVLSAATGLVLCLLTLSYYQEQLPGEAVGIISTIAGIFGSCLKDAYAFEFGSSRGSKTKDLASLFSAK